MVVRHQQTCRELSILRCVGDLFWEPRCILGGEAKLSASLRNVCQDEKVCTDGSPEIFIYASSDTPSECVCVFVCGIMFEREMRPHRVSESPAAGETAQVLFILFLVLRVWISVSYS